MPPPRLQRSGKLIRPIGAVAPARGLNVQIYGEIYEESCPVRVWRIARRQVLYLRVFFPRTCSLTSDPWGVGYPAAVNSVGACAGRFGAQLWDGRPENTCHPGFVETAINICFAERKMKELLLLYVYVYVCM